MNKTLLGVAGAMCLGLFTTFAHAAPLAGSGDSKLLGVTSQVVPAHGIHFSCKRDRHGWHRSHIWGRERCRPRAKTWYRWWN